MASEEASVALEAAALGEATSVEAALEEVALAARFLCSDASRGMIGQTLVVDGGARITACE